MSYRIGGSNENVTQALARRAIWTDKETWKTKKGESCQGAEYSKLIQYRVSSKYTELTTDWLNSSNKDIYENITKHHYRLRLNSQMPMIG